MATNSWTRIGEGLRRNDASGKIFANIWHEGKNYRQSLKTNDKTTARNKLTEFRKKLVSGEVSNAQNTTIAEISPRFIASLSGMSESSQTRSKGHMKAFVEEFGEENPRDIKPMDLREWLQELREEEEFGEDCWNKYRMTMQKLWDFLITNSFASDNPTKSLDYLTAKAQRKFTPSTEQVNAILGYIHKHMPKEKETWHFVKFLALTGQGKAEAVHAIWQDIQWETKNVNFYRQKTRAKAHTMPLFAALRAFLEARMNGRKMNPAEPLFKIKDAKKAIGKACEKLGIPHMGHHAFRRYFVTQCGIMGIHPTLVAKWIGHKNTDMVMEIYTNIPNAHEVSVADKLQDIGV